MMLLLTFFVLWNYCKDIFTLLFLVGLGSGFVLGWVFLGGWAGFLFHHCINNMKLKCRNGLNRFYGL